MRNENIGTANIKVLEVEQIDVQDGTIEKYVGIDSNGAVVKSTSGGGGGAGLVDGDYGDVVVSGVGTVMTIDDLAVTTAKIADNAVELGKIQAIGQHKLIGRHSTGDGIPHQIGVTNGIEFTGQDIGIADSGVTQAKLDATGAAAGKVLTTDGTAMTWETPTGGGLTLPIDETVGVYSNEAAIVLTLENPSLGFTTFPKGVTLDIAGFTGDATGRGVGLEITGANGQSSGGDCYSLAIKSGDPISTTHILNTEQNYLTIDSSHVRIGGVYEWNEGYAGQSSFAITGSLNIDINNPSIPIGDGSVTETKLADSSVTQAKISATGADVGKVLTTDGTTMTWETPYTAPTGTADNTTRFNTSGQLVETNVIAISDTADVYVTGNTFDVILNTGGSEIYMDSTSGYIQLENGDNLDGGGLILSSPGGPNLRYGLDAADSIAGQSVTYLVKLDANTYTGNGSILVGEYDVAEDVPKWGFRNIADYTTPANGSITQAKLSATGAAAGKVLQSDGAGGMSWQTVAGGSVFGEIIYRNMNSLILTDVARIADWNVLYNNYYSAASATNLRFLSTQNTLLYGTVATKIRQALMYNGSTWGVTAGLASFIETSTTGSSFSNIDTPIHNFNATLSNSNYMCDFASSKVVIGILRDCASYLYSENISTFTKVDVLNSILTRPFISGNVYSFWNSTNSARVYTTDHTNYTNCTNFGSSDLQIQRMSNGWLYTTTGTTLKVSTDNGITWTTRILPATVSTAGIHNIDTNGATHVYCAGGNGLWTTPDFITWTPRASNIPGTNANHRVIYVAGLFFVFSGTASTGFSTCDSYDNQPDAGTAWIYRLWGTGQSLIGNDVLFVDSKIFILTNTKIQVFSSMVYASEIAVGNTNTDNLYLTFYGSGTKVSFISGNVWYFYNAGVWTTITSSQGLSNVLSISLTANNTHLIKVT